MNVEHVKEYIQFVDLDILLSPLKVGFWQHDMGQDYEEIKIILNSESKIKRLLGKSKVTTFILYFLLAVVMGESELDNSKTKKEIINDLSSVMAGKAKYINLVGLINFLDGIRNDAIKYLSKSFLDHEQAAICNYNTTSENKTDDVTAMTFLIFSQDPKKIHLIEGFESVIRSKFNDYVMNIADISDDDISVNKDELRDKLSQGIDFENINNASVERIIEMVDNEDDSNFSSRLLELFIDNDYLYIFILREYKRSKLRKIDETNVGNEVELIVLRFNSYLKLCSIKSHNNNEKNALKISNKILEDNLGKYF